MTVTFQARILRAGVTAFTAGCRLLPPHTPRFGDLVRTDRPGLRLFGLLYDVRMGDDPAVRQLILADRLEPEVLLDQRENRLVPLELDVLLVGYRHDDGPIICGLAPQPPVSLDTMTVCPPAELREFSTRLDYLPRLLHTTHLPVDELLAAHLNLAAAVRAPAAQTPFRIDAGRALARLLHHDQPRLARLLHRIRPR